MDQASWIVNTLVSRLGPWYQIEFQLIAESFILAKIGKYNCRFSSENDEPFDGLICDCADLPYGDRTIQATNFINHINGILAGKVRNDAGELVSA